jgi:hypothetical protein
MVNFAWAPFSLRRFLPLLVLLVAAPASAAVDVVYSISNSYGYLMGANTGATPDAGGLAEQHYVASTDPAKVSELGINYDTYTAPGGFYFLHQDYCVGSCSVYSSTVVTIMLTNTDSNPVDLRFDTMITPGHLASISPTAFASGNYAFKVIQNPGGGGGDEFTLYDSSGTIDPDTLHVYPDNGGLYPDGLEFNGLTTTLGNPIKTIDWGATNLSVPLLTIAGNTTSTLSYVASYQISNDGVCTDLTDCSSLEVVFGDPRNDGSVLALRAFGHQSALPLNKAVVGGGYDPFFVPISFVAVGSLDPDAPPDAPVINYTRNFKSNAIDDGNMPAAPEPATWLTMLCGFGVAGLALRRRSGSIATAG